VRVGRGVGAGEDSQSSLHNFKCVAFHFQVILRGHVVPFPPGFYTFFFNENFAHLLHGYISSIMLA